MDAAGIARSFKAAGTAVFGIDVDVPDMHHAAVVRSPVAGGAVME